MPHSDVAQLIHVTAAKLSQRRADIVDIDVDQMGRPFLTERTEAPQERLAGKRCVCAQRDSPGRVDT